MSTSLSSAPELPSNLVIVDKKVSTFTLAGGATGNDYEVTGTRASVRVNDALNVTGTGNEVFGIINSYLYALNSSSQTDTITINIQYSTDGGTVWTTVNQAGAAFTGGDPAGKSSIQYSSGVMTATLPVTNPVLIRLAIADATDPTTDAVTLTNIRYTLLMIGMK